MAKLHVITLGEDGYHYDILLEGQIVETYTNEKDDVFIIEIAGDPLKIRPCPGGIKGCGKK